jgi:tRNA dimethylallyltransferase
LPPIDRASRNSSRSLIPVIIVAGPTASGKSALALAIAIKFGGAVINADSMQIYRGLEILTAAPDDAARKQVPHYLYGVRDPGDPCSAGEWRDLAVAEIHRADDAGLLPVVTGGTGLYLRSLMTGIAAMPPVPADIRESVRARLTAQGATALHDELSRQDPEGAARLSPGDSQRIARALEVLEATGRTLGDWQREGAQNSGGNPFRFATILLMPERAALYQTCNDRFAEMLESGALDEVRALGHLGLDPSLPVMKALGVPELLGFLAGKTPYDEALQAGQQATRRYVKRQMTWFRRQIVADIDIKTEYNDSYDVNTFSFITKFLLTHGI